MDEDLSAGAPFAQDDNVLVIEAAVIPGPKGGTWGTPFYVLSCCQGTSRSAFTRLSVSRSSACGSLMLTARRLMPTRAAVSAKVYS